MAYVNMTKDFSEVKKIIPGLGITKRQLIGFIAGASVGLPVFFFLKNVLKLDMTVDVFGMGCTAAPVMILIMIKRDGLYMEKHIKYWYETHFIRNTDRPYKTNNLHQLLKEEERLKEEVERIIFKGKTPAQIQAIKEKGETSQVRIGRKKITIPMRGPIDKNTKKELEKAVKKAKLKGEIPESAQDTIPYRVPYPDGIFESADKYFTQTICFEDITYQLLDNDPKNMLFERWCKIINFFEPEVHFQFNYGNMEIDKEEYSRDFIIDFKNDDFNIVRKEYSDMLVNQFAKGTNNLKKERYLTYGITATDYKTAKLKLGKLNKQIEKSFMRLGCKAHIMDGYERLNLLFRIFHPATKEKLMWNFDMPVDSGISSKDFIAPSSFSFKSGPNLNATRYFRSGDRVGAVNYVKVYAADMEDRIISDILNMDSNIWISIHADTMNRKKALDYAKDNVTEIDGMIINMQKDAMHGGWDMDILPPDLRIYQDAADKLYKDAYSTGGEMQDINIELEVGEDGKVENINYSGILGTGNGHSSTLLTEPGTATAHDKVTTDGSDSGEKVFYTVTTAEGDTFYMIVDQRQNNDNVYLLNAVTRADLAALAVDGSEEGNINDTTKDKKEDSLLDALQNEKNISSDSGSDEKTLKEDNGGGLNPQIIVIIAVLIGGGVYYYLKVYKNKKDEQMDVMDAMDMEDFAAEPEDNEDEEAEFELADDEKQEYLNNLINNKEEETFYNTTPEEYAASKEYAASEEDSAKTETEEVPIASQTAAFESEYDPELDGEEDDSDWEEE